MKYWSACSWLGLSFWKASFLTFVCPKSSPELELENLGLRFRRLGSFSFFLDFLLDALWQHFLFFTTGKNFDIPVGSLLFGNILFEWVKRLVCCDMLLLNCWRQPRPQIFTASTIKCTSALEESIECTAALLEVGDWTFATLFRPMSTVPEFRCMLLWNSQNREHQKYLWNVIVLREINQ